MIGYNPASVNVGQAWLNKGASLYFVNGEKITPTWSGFTVGKDGEQIPMKVSRNITGEKEAKGKRGLQLEEAVAFMEAANEVAEAVVPKVGGLTVLQGQNGVNDGTTSEWMKKLKASPLGAGDYKVETAFASLHGDATTCNVCGYKGDVATDIIGPAAGACSASAAETANTACSMDQVQISRADGTVGPLPEWMLAATKMYDPATGKTDLIDTSILTSTFKVGCSAVSKEKAATMGEITSCLDPALVAEALKALVADDCARLNLQTRNGISTPDLKDHIPDNFAEAFPTSAHTDVYDLSFTTHGKACTDKMTAWIKGADNEALLKSLAPSAGADLVLDATDVSLTTVHNVKGNDMAAALKQVMDTMATSAAQTGLPTVLVAGGGAGRFAFPQLVAGTVADVALGNFADSKPISLELASKCVLGGMDKESNVPLGSFTPSAGVDALDKVPVTIPAGTAPGTYSIRATQGGLSWCSQPMDVKA